MSCNDTVSSKKSKSEEIIEIDGSFGEGGGQIIRNAVSFCCLLKKQIKVFNIRAGRPNPGLASQHLESILALKRVAGVKTNTFLQKGVTEFDLDGEAVKIEAEGVHTKIDLKTAGSTSLSMQCFLPYLFTLSTASNIRVIGGTHVMKAPSFDYLERVFIPNMTLIGFELEAKLIKPGYYPRGGGCVDLKIVPTANGKFNSFELIDRGSFKKCSSILNMPNQLMNNSKQAKDNIPKVMHKNLEIRNVPFASFEIFYEFENCNAGISYLVEGKNPKFENLMSGIEKVLKEGEEFLQSTALVDAHMADQLIIYMALAKIKNYENLSKIKTIKPTDHTLSAIHVAEKFASGDIKFSIKELEEDKHTYLIEL